MYFVAEENCDGIIGVRHILRFWPKIHLVNFATRHCDGHCFGRGVFCISLRLKGDDMPQSAGVTLLGCVYYTLWQAHAVEVFAPQHELCSKDLAVLQLPPLLSSWWAVGQDTLFSDSASLPSRCGARLGRMSTCLFVEPAVFAYAESSYAKNTYASMHCVGMEHTTSAHFQRTER